MQTRCESKSKEPQKPRIARKARNKQNEEADKQNQEAGMKRNEEESETGRRKSGRIVRQAEV